MSHVRFGTVQQSLELQSVGVAVRDNVAHLTDNRGEYKYANQVADDRENVSANKGGDGIEGRGGGVGRKHVDIYVAVLCVMLCRFVCLYVGVLVL